MRNLLLWGLLLCGCAHQQPAGKVSAFDQAYAEVASGVRPSVHSGGYLIAKSGGAVHVAREAPGGGIQRDVSDGWITGEVKSRLGSRDIEVATDGGVVTLRGKPGSREQAMQAIRAALDQDGVTGVNSELRF